MKGEDSAHPFEDVYKLWRKEGEKGIDPAGPECRGRGRQGPQRQGIGPGCLCVQQQDLHITPEAETLFKAGIQDECPHV